ncbi:MAG: M48 family metallopeptidase [Candidatus Komeilibacteria bacterium]|jgi:heat shock protein HtpX|nr:M48 family metallopeptidase [Candidatus Komeilibacteria bacterium]MBT4447959.1 M48 family metallopeptidase [Candidatus Komeilibacteria bacterium]
MYKQIDSNKRKSLALMVLFVLVIVGMVWAWAQYSESGYYMIIPATLFATGMSAVSFFAGDKIALATAGAKEIKKDDNPYLWRMVENLSITAGLTMPKVHIIEDASMNAFATGRDPAHSSIAVTTGLLNNLKNEELEGVIAHELSHVKNYDIRLMMVVIVCVGIITLLADWMMRSFIFRGRDDNNKGNILMIVGIVLAVLSPLFAKLIQMAVSRKREFLADASASLLTRYPEGLASALEKISSQNIPLKRANKATAHLYISSPFKGKGISKLFSTHPPAQERIKALRNM